MKRKFVLALVLVLALAAQSFAHTASISWSNSPDTSNTNVYRLAGTCPATTTGFVKITATPVTTANYTDSTVSPGVYCYYVTATLNGSESVPSNTAQATVPVAPPSGLSITSVSMIINPNGTETVLAKWTDSSGTQQDFRFSDGSKFVSQGLTSSLTGSFAQTFTGPAGTAITFIACNSQGSCASQKAM